MLLGVNASSFGNYGFPKYWKEKSYEKLKEFGYSYVNFSILGDNTTDFFKVFYAADPTARKDILLHERMLVEAAGLKVNQAHAPCLSLERALTEQEISSLIENIKIAIEGCQILNCRNLVVHPFMPNGWSDRGTPIAKDTFQKNVAYLQQLGAYAEKFDVTICLENLPCVGFSISTPDEVLAVLKAVDRDNVKMCLDTGHLAAFSYDLHLGQEVRKCGKQIKVLHVHDNYGRADQHNFPGMGITDWVDAVKAFNEIEFKGVFSLELNFPDKFSEPVFESSCRLAVAMATEIINGLQ